MGNTSSRFRKIFRPFVFVFGLCLLVGFAWGLITTQDESIGLRLLGGVFAFLFSAAFVLVGYDWMRGRVSMKFPKRCEDETDNS